LDLAGIGRQRLQLRWVSAAEGQLFADTVTELSEQSRSLGPFTPEKFQLSLAAIESVLKSSRIRWLIGMDRQLTERANVYNEKIEPSTFRQFLNLAVEQEYQKALILESLADGPRSVREIARSTGLPIYTISLRLNDLERSGQADLHGFEGTTPKFVRLAA